MSKKRTIENIEKNINRAISAISMILKKIYHTDPLRADKISFWLRDYANYLDFEIKFKPDRFKNYKRGDIIKVNFGFRLGCELGGLHYAVVLNDNAIKSPMLTVIPLSSKKDNTALNKLPPDRLFLGNEIFEQILTKCENQLSTLRNELDVFEDEEVQLLDEKKLNILKKKYINTQKVYDEIKKLNFGSIAVIGQITSISKMRIQDPQSNSDVLSGIRLSKNNLDNIDLKINELFTNNS